MRKRLVGVTVSLTSTLTLPLPRQTSLRQLKLKCGPQFEAQWKCLAYYNQTFDKCRTTQSALDECVFETMVGGGAANLNPITTHF